MSKIEVQNQWESAAPGWAKWEGNIAKWTWPATEAMLEMADVIEGYRVLDLASGAGSQAFNAAQRVGCIGQVVASDISETMLSHVKKNAHSAGLKNISTLVGAAEDLQVSADSFDAVICRYGLMLFTDPAKALTVVRHALRSEGKMAAVVFTTPATNPFFAKPMQILLRHAGKSVPPPGSNGLFSLGSPGVIKHLFEKGGLVNFESRIFKLSLQMPSAKHALEMLKESAGAYRAVIHDCPKAVQEAAWAEVLDMLTDSFETDNGFEAPAEVLVAAGTKPS